MGFRLRFSQLNQSIDIEHGDFRGYPAIFNRHHVTTSESWDGAAAPRTRQVLLVQGRCLQDLCAASGQTLMARSSKAKSTASGFAKPNNGGLTMKMEV